MTNLLPLWRIEEELEALVNSVDTCPEELQEQLEAQITRYLGAEASKVDQVGAVLTSFDATMESAKREIERLRARQQSVQKAAERLEAYILRVLHARGDQPLKGRNVTLSVRHTEALVIDDPGAVPAEWKRQTVSIDIPKDPIKKALKAGESVPGVHIERKDHLQRK
jgi:hypothetical protein